MSNNINAYCSICGKGYHVCNSCLEQRTFKPWRTVTESIEHYKIYLAIHDYTISGDKQKAKKELENCDLSELENFIPEIRSVIKEILKEDEQKKCVKNNKKEDSKSALLKKKQNFNE